MNSRPFGGGLVRSCLCLCVFAFYDKATTHTLSHTYDQLAARARAERQRAARARVGHPAGAAGAAAAAAAFPGARRTADPARAPRQVRVLDAPHVCAACPALALAQGGAPRAFLVGLGGRVLASSCSQPYSMPPIVPHVPVIPHGRQWSQHGEEGARRPWGAPGCQGGAIQQRQAWQSKWTN